MLHRGNVQIEVDPPPSHPIFDKFIFDTVLIMLTSLPTLEFNKNHEILGFKTYIFYCPYVLLSEGYRYRQKDGESLG